VIGPAQTLPAGLLGLLGIKSLGRSLDGMSETLLPVIDITDLLTVGRGLEWSSGTINSAGALTDTTVLITTGVPAAPAWPVPTGTLRLVKRLTGRINITAGAGAAEFSGWLVRRFQGASFTEHYLANYSGSHKPEVVLGDAPVVVGSVFDLLLRPGEQLGYKIGVSAATGVNTDYSFQFVDFQF